MSLKFVHLLFISASSLMALGVALWAIGAWRHDGDASWLALAGIGLVGGGLLVIYGNRFLRKTRKLGIALLCVTGTLALPENALACPVCMGDTDSILRSGMNMGIFVLLGVVAVMWVCFAAFFIHLMKKSRAAPGTPSMDHESRRQFGTQPQEGSI